MGMKVFIKNIEGISIPTKGTEVSAGYDIIATSDPKIVGELDGGKYKSISYIEYETNIHISPEFINIHTLVLPRSSICKTHLVLSNSCGLIDNDYSGQILCRFKYCWNPEDLTSAMPNLSKIYIIN